MKSQQKFERRTLKILWLLSCAILTVCAVLSPIVVVSVALERSKPVVVIDAGHGGEDGGVTGVRTKAKESDLNLSVALLLGEYLKSGGFKVTYTRKTDIMLSNPTVKGSKKRADLFKRGDIINKAKPVMVISVHMNFYSSGARRGAQVFYSAKNDGSRFLAECVQTALNEDINSDIGRQYSSLCAEKYLLSCSPYPTVIAECGFLSNPLDEALLTSPDYQAKLAYTLFKGMTAFCTVA